MVLLAIGVLVATLFFLLNQKEEQLYDANLQTYTQIRDTIDLTVADMKTFEETAADPTDDAFLLGRIDSRLRSLGTIALLELRERQPDAPNQFDSSVGDYQAPSARIHLFVQQKEDVDKARTYLRITGSKLENYEAFADREENLEENLKNFILTWESILRETERFPK